MRRVGGWLADFHRPKIVPAPARDLFGEPRFCWDASNNEYQKTQCSRLGQWVLKVRVGRGWGPRLPRFPTQKKEIQIHTYTNIYTYIYMYMYATYICIYGLNIYICIDMYAYIHIYTYIHIYIYNYVHVYVYIYS